MLQYGTYKHSLAATRKWLQQVSSLVISVALIICPVPNKCKQNVLSASLNIYKKYSFLNVPFGLDDLDRLEE